MPEGANSYNATHPLAVHTYGAFSANSYFETLQKIPQLDYSFREVKELFYIFRPDGFVAKNSRIMERYETLFRNFQPHFSYSKTPKNPTVCSEYRESL